MCYKDFDWKYRLEVNWISYFENIYMTYYKEITWHSSYYETCRSTGMENPRHWRDHLRDKVIHSVHGGKKITHYYKHCNSNYMNITCLTFLWAFTAGWLFIYDAFHISGVFNDFSLTLLLASSCLWLKKRKGTPKSILCQYSEGPA